MVLSVLFWYLNIYFMNILKYSFLLREHLLCCALRIQNTQWSFFFLIFAKFNIATDLSAKDSREFLQNPISKIGLCYFNIKRKAQPMSTNISGKRTNGATILSPENFSLLNSYNQTAFYALYLESWLRTLQQYRKQGVPYFL